MGNQGLRLCAAMVATLSLAVAAESAPPPSGTSDMALGFAQISRDRFFATYRRIGILPVELPKQLSGRDDARQAFELTLIRYLKAANIEAVPSAGYQAIFDRLNHEAGGSYDSLTGKMRPQVASSVVQKARQEFLESNHLDGFVLPRVVEGSGLMSGRGVFWDDVKDFSAGRERKREDSWWPVGLRGNLPVLTLHLQVFRSPDRINFARYGGIQPLSYAREFDREWATFVAPPVEELLKDQARIERAVRVATNGLSPRPIDMTNDVNWPGAANLPPLPEPEDPGPKSPFHVPRERILNSVHRVVLTPVFEGDLKVPEAVRQRILANVRAELEPLHWEIVDAPGAHEALLRQLMQVQIFDPYTGKRDEAAISAASKAAIDSLGLIPAPDAVLWMSVVRTAAMQRLGDAVWDGADQNALTMAPVKKIGKLAAHFRFSMYSAPGWSTIPATSLQLRLADSSDSLLYMSRGGIQLLERIMSNTVRGEPEPLKDSELFQDAMRDRQAVHLALRDLVLTPEALAAELRGVNGK